MSGTTRALGWPLLQLLTGPAPIAGAALPLWPLQSMLVFDRIPHPFRFTTGAPLSVNDTSDKAWAWSNVRMQEFSVPLPGATSEVALTAIEEIDSAASTLVGTDAEAVAL